MRFRRLAVLLVALIMPSLALGEEAETEGGAATAETDAAPEGAEGTEAAEAPETTGEAAPEESPPPTPAPTATVTRAAVPTRSSAERLTVLFTSDTHGQLVDAPCGAEDVSPLLPRVAAASAAERARADAAGEIAPLLLDTGDGLFPSPLANELGADGGRASALVSALRQARYDAIAPGAATLTAPTPTVLGLLEAARAGELPIVTSNIGCAGDVEDSSACEAAAAGLLSPHALISRGSVTIGVMALLPEGYESRARTGTVAGATVTAPGDAAASTVAELRGAGADIVILLSYLDTPDTAPRTTLDLLGGLDEDARPDLVLTARTSSVVQQMVAPDGGPPIVAAAGGSLGRVVLERSGDGWSLADAGVAELPAEGDASVGGTVAGWRTAFCQAHAEPLARGRLAADLDREAFTGLVLRAIREQTRAEVAFINARAVSAHAGYPMTGQLTAEQVVRAIPDDTELRMATVRGSDIVGLLDAVFDSGRAIAAGAEREDGDIKINGRDIDPDGTYRVVTTAFVAAGGEGIVEADAARWRAPDEDHGGEAALAQRVGTWLTTEREETPYDPESDLNLYRQPLWYASLTVDASIADASIWNSAGYDQAQLSRQRVFDVRGEAELRAGFSTRDHRWDNHLVLRYGRQRIESEAGSREYAWGESADLVNFRSAYTLDYLRNAVLEGAWYGPSIFLEYRLESEFYHESAGEDDDSPHFLEMTGLLGLKLTPTPWLLFQAAGGVRGVLLVDDPFPMPGLGLRAEVLRRRFPGLEDVPLYFAAVADYFVGWPVGVPDDGINLPSEGSAVHKFSLEGRLEFQIYGPLSLTASARMFLYDEDTGPVAIAVDTTAGLRVALSGHTQDF